MAQQIADRVCETTTTSGTGTYALGGAKSGFQAFSSVCANGDTAEYVATDGTNWEVGLGTWSTGNNFARTTIYASSNANAAVSWSGVSKDIFIDVPARFFQILANPITAKTANYSVLATDNGKHFTNGGAAGSVNFSLPTLVVGLKYRFIATAAQTVIVTADSGHTLRNGPDVTASSGNLTSDGTKGVMIDVEAVSSTEWYVTHITGSWTVN